MNPKDIKLLETIRRSPESTPDELIAMLIRMYGHVIRKDVIFHSRMGFISQEAEGQAKQVVARDFIEVVRDMGGEVSGGPTVRQLLHLVTVQAALRFYLESRTEGSSLNFDFNEGSKNQYASLRSEFYYAFPRLWRPSVIARQLIVVESEKRMTPDFLSSAVMPYITAIADVQRVCNAVLKRPEREVTFNSISQNSPMSIKLFDAAQAINTLKEDIIPWRRENAKNLALLKEVEVAADIKKKEEEALEIRARSAKDQAESEKIRAEAAKVREEAEQLRIENDKRRFELQKAKFELALDIVSKIQPRHSSMSEYSSVSIVVHK